MYTVSISPVVARIVKKYRSDKRVSFEKVVELLKNDRWNPVLKTHKLGGKLKDTWSCRVDYSDRALFMIFVDNEITIVDIGNNDVVYRNN